MNNGSESNFSLKLTENQKMIRETVRDFAENKIRPVLMDYDEKQEFPKDLIMELGELGLLGIIIPEKYGGSGLGYIEYALVVDELARVDPSISLSVAAHNGLCTNHIYTFGSEHLREKYVKPLASGKSIGAWGLTEPGSGSDAAGLKTTARKEGDHYILNGTKNFTTHGSVGDFTVIMAITDPDKGSKGISAFVVENSNEGYNIGKKENKLGMRASDTTQVILEECKIPAENLIGNEGEGFKQAMKILEGGRISIAALSTGVIRGCLEACVNYSKEREQFGKALSSFQATRFKLADMAADLEAAELLTYSAAEDKNNGLYITRRAAVAKLFTSEAAVRAANEAVQIFGGYGFIKDYPVEKFYRDVKLLTIGEGTSEIQRIVIARNLLK